MLVRFIRDAITVNGGTPRSYWPIEALRELVAAYGGAPTQYDEIGLWREAAIAAGGTPTGFTETTLVHDILVANGVANPSFNPWEMGERLASVIVSNDGAPPPPPPVPTIIMSPDITLTEGDSGETLYQFTATVDRDGSTEVFDYTWAASGDGTNPANAADFVGDVFPSGSGTMASGASTVTMTARVKGDTSVESNERFKVTINMAGVGTASAFGTITNDDDEVVEPAPYFTIEQASQVVDEGSNGVVTYRDYRIILHRDGYVGDVAYTYSVVGSGANPAQASDFLGGFSVQTDSGTFTGDETIKRHAVLVDGDNTAEVDREYTFSVSSPVVPTASVTSIIRDDDSQAPSPAVAFTQPPQISGLAKVGETLSFAGSTFTNAEHWEFQWFAADTSTGGALAIPNATGETLLVTPDLLGKFLRIQETIGGPGGMASYRSDPTTAVVASSAPAPNYSISGPVVQNEGNSGATAFAFVLTLNRNGVSGDIPYSWSTRGIGTNPANAADFVGGAFPVGGGTFTGSQTTKAITVNVQGDATIETDETFSLDVPTGSGVQGASAQGTITNDDTAAVDSFSTTFANGEKGIWLDVKEQSTVRETTASTSGAAVGTPIGRFLDRSPNANHISQATLGQRPHLRLDAQGRRCLESDGQDDMLNVVFNAPFTAAQFTRVSVIRQIGYTPAARIFGSGSNNTAHRIIALLLQRLNSPALQQYNGIYGIDTGDQLPLGQIGIVTEVIDGTNSKIAINNGAYLTANVGSQIPDGLTLFAGSDATGHSSVAVYEVMMINRVLTSTEINNARSTLAQKHGIAL